MKAQEFLRIAALAVAAMAVTSSMPVMAQATEIRYLHLVRPSTADAVEHLMKASLMGGQGQPAIHQVATFNRGELLMSVGMNANKARALSAGTLVKVIESDACNLIVHGPCIVAENGVVMNLGVKQNEDGSKTVIQGTFDTSGLYQKRVIKDKRGRKKTVEVSLLSKITDLLAKRTKGLSVIYSRASGSMPSIDIKERAPIAGVPESKVEVVTEASTGSRSFGICALSAAMKVKSFHLGVGWTDAVGRGTITCKHFDGHVEKLAVKIVSEARGVGIGADFGSDAELVASGMGLTMAGIKGFLGNYAVATGGGQLGVGLDVGISLTADGSGIVIPAGLRGKIGVGLGAAADAGRLTITEDDGMAPAFPAHQVIQEFPNNG